jgi:hypothetical protein
MKLFLSHKDIVNIYNAFNYVTPKLKEKYPYEEICNKNILITGNTNMMNLKKKNNNKILVKSKNKFNKNNNLNKITIF